jgi:hypothetical protein
MPVFALCLEQCISQPAPGMVEMPVICKVPSAANPVFENGGVQENL